MVLNEATQFSAGLRGIFDGSVEVSIFFWKKLIATAGQQETCP
jgi:hypothetical protein